MHSRRTWLCLAAAIASEVAASLSLKAALDDRAFYLVAGIGYTASFVLLGAVLRAGMPLGVAYGIWGAVGVAATAVLSAALLGEPFTGLMAVGIGLVVIGVLVVELGSQAAGDRDGGAA